MIYHVTNGDICVGNLKLQEIVTGSSLFIGDTQTVTLMSIFETPPETLIVGVTTPRRR
ncbi:spore gernimation protein [Brevibacillus sp. NRS-1366]|uniref:spore gernimation protein n=1 Tax=Brevibacillus sp. NRS-1366 TaxID=3233899 RepID=UPI003D227828